MRGFQGAKKKMRNVEGAWNGHCPASMSCHASASSAAASACASAVLTCTIIGQGQGKEHWHSIKSTPKSYITFNSGSQILVISPTLLNPRNMHATKRAAEAWSMLRWTHRGGSVWVSLEALCLGGRGGAGLCCCRRGLTL